MFKEERNVGLSRPRERPSGFGYTLVLRPSDPLVFLDRLREVWRIVASWGRFCDEDAGDYPSTDECLESLPEDFAQELRQSRAEDIEGWLDDVHDRDWVLWSSACIGRDVRIDLDSNSMPLSSWPIRLVAEVIDPGTEVVYADSWRAES